MHLLRFSAGSDYKTSLSALVPPLDHGRGYPSQVPLTLLKFEAQYSPQLSLGLLT